MKQDLEATRDQPQTSGDIPQGIADDASSSWV